MRARILFDQCSDIHIAFKTNKTVSSFVRFLRFLPPAYRTSGTTNCMLSLWKLRKIMGFFAKPLFPRAEERRITKLTAAQILVTR